MQAMVRERVYLRSGDMGWLMVEHVPGKVESIPFDGDKLPMVESCIGKLCCITLDHSGVIDSLVPVTIRKCSVSQT